MKTLVLLLMALAFVASASAQTTAPASPSKVKIDLGTSTTAPGAKTDDKTKAAKPDPKKKKEEPPGKIEGLAVARGIALSGEDRMRGWVIERLMCEFAVSIPELRDQFGEAAGQLLDEMQVAAREDTNVALDEGLFAVSDAARPFVRSIAARFDSYLGSGAARHSASV